MSDQFSEGLTIHQKRRLGHLCRMDSMGRVLPTIPNTSLDISSYHILSVSNLLTQMLGENFVNKLGSEIIIAAGKDVFGYFNRLVIDREKFQQFIDVQPLKALPHSVAQASDYSPGELIELTEAFILLGLPPEQRAKRLIDRDMFAAISLVINVTLHDKQGNIDRDTMANRGHPLRPLAKALGLFRIEDLPDHLPGIVVNKGREFEVNMQALETLVQDQIAQQDAFIKRHSHDVRRGAEDAPPLTLDEARKIQGFMDSRMNARFVGLTVLENLLGTGEQSADWWRQKLTLIGSVRDGVSAHISKSQLKQFINDRSPKAEVKKISISQEQLRSMERTPADERNQPGEKGKLFLSTTLVRLLGSDWEDKIAGFWKESDVGTGRKDEILINVDMDRLRSAVEKARRDGGHRYPHNSGEGRY